MDDKPLKTPPVPIQATTRPYLIKIPAYGDEQFVTFLAENRDGAQEILVLEQGAAQTLLEDLYGPLNAALRERLDDLKDRGVITWEEPDDEGYLKIEVLGETESHVPVVAVDGFVTGLETLLHAQYHKG